MFQWRIYSSRSLLKSGRKWLLLLSLGCPGHPARPDYGWIEIIFNCLLHQNTQQLTSQRKGTVAVHCRLCARISPHCCSVNDLRGGREKQLCLYVFHLSAESFGKERVGWKCFVFQQWAPLRSWEISLVPSPGWTTPACVHGTDAPKPCFSLLFSSGPTPTGPQIYTGCPRAECRSLKLLICMCFGIYSGTTYFALRQELLKVHYINVLRRKEIKCFISLFGNYQCLC